MEEEIFITIMGINMKENGKMMLKKVKVPIIGKMEKNMKENGKRC